MLSTLGRNADTAERMPLVEHLRELRSRLIKAAIAIVAGVIVAFLLRNHVIGVLEDQVCGDTSINGIGKATAQCPNGVLTLSGPTAGITLAFKVAFLGGLCLSAPAWLYQFWAFLAPGLYKKESRYGLGFVTLATPLFASGCALCYLFFPKIMQALLGSAFTPRGVAVQLPVDTFLTFYLRMMVVFGISFVLPLFLIVFNTLGLLSGTRMAQHWRIIVLTIFIFAAIAVPTGDPIGMTVLATPLCILYAAAVVFAKTNDRRKLRRHAADPLNALSPDQPSPLDLTPTPLDETSPLATSSGRK